VILKLLDPDPESASLMRIRIQGVNFGSETLTKTTATAWTEWANIPEALEVVLYEPFVDEILPSEDAD